VALGTVGAGRRGDADRAAVAALAARIMSLRVTGSSVSDLADVACGRADGFVTTGSGRWDLAAGGLLAAEAGAVVTTADGRPADGPVGSLVAAAPPLHDELVGLFG
jgi:myo-inositol-1(or 4)-monophosphatase